MCNSRKIVWWNTDKSVRWQNVTNLLFRHRVFASVNPSCVCNMFVVCVKRTVGILLSFSWTFLCILYVRLWSCFFKNDKFPILRRCLFSFYYPHAIFICRLYLYVSNNSYCLSSGLINIIFYFHFDYSTKVFIQQFIVLIKLTLLQTKVRRLKFVVPD